MSGKSQIDATKTEPDPGATNPFRATVDGVFMAVGFMTRLPVPFRHGDMARAMWAFPIAGALVGAIAGAVLWGAHLLGLPPLASVILALVASAAATGALHEDGLADCADGFWGGATPERRLEIMRDSRSGAYGVLALVLATGLKASLLGALLTSAGPIIAAASLVSAHALARAGLPGMMAVWSPPGSKGLAAAVGRPGAVVASVAMTLGIAAVVLLGWIIGTGFVGTWAALVMVLAGLIAWGVVGALAKEKLGGVNGDTLGAAEQVAEILGLAALVIVLG